MFMYAYKYVFEKMSRPCLTFLSSSKQRCFFTKNNCKNKCKNNCIIKCKNNCKKNRKNSLKNKCKKQSQKQVLKAKK